MPKINTRLGSGGGTISAVIAITGMTIAETHQYLVARGVECGEGSVRSWSKGTYNPPTEAVERLWELVIWLFDDVLKDGLEELPDDLPQQIETAIPDSVRRRAEAVNGLIEWWRLRHPVRNF